MERALRFRNASGGDDSAQENQPLEFIDRPGMLIFTLGGGDMFDVRASP